MSRRGWKQAELLGDYYRSAEFDFIYSSDLGRAVDTAKAILGDCRRRALKLDQSLRERKFGVFEGLTRQEAEAKHPEAYQTWVQGAFDFKAEGGESRRELLQRSKAKMEEIAQQHAGKYILIVVHGGLLSTFWRHLEPSRGEDEGFKIPNASITELIYEDNCWDVLSWSKTDHLEGLEALIDLTV